MITQTVRADTGGRESKWVGIFILAILLFASLSIPYNQAKPSTQKVLPHQLLISDIEQENLAMIAELRLAHEEIRDLFMDSYSELSERHQVNANEVWPSIAQLESDWVAPFVKDQSWARKGQHEWFKLGEGRYLGVPQSSNAAKPFILDSSQTTPQIWLLTEAQDDSIKVVTVKSSRPEHLIKQGWKHVIMNSEQDKHQH
ncbi:hypothetical protein [uncultured Vibrio sp.]|uniref:DUF6162 family protein n=1 Tax=uncultured Vibrio sp. TaxID=114054 RepID=UPI0009222C44|nr:hypothetical protein [uncultured Vibrio sp.]OIQ26265.1 MAG: hypothetical protein BM561_00425 [Vibrio sp. MedPE-SWchi]